MKKILMILFSMPAFLMAQVSVDWVQIVGETGIATDNNNNVYTTYFDYNPAGDIYVTKRNSSGVIQWTVKYDQTDNSKWEKSTWVECDMQGNVIVSGSLMSGYSNPVNAASILMKFSPAGTLLWRVVYESSFDGSYTKKCIVDKANSIYVLGLGTGPNGFVSKVKKFNSSGIAQWSYFDNAGIGAALNFKFTPDSNIVIAGKSITGSFMGYSKIDRNGNNIWNLAGVQSLTAGDLAGDAFGNTYIVHGIYTGGTGSTIKKLAPNGLLTWSINYNNISAFRVEVGNDNKPVICGYPIPGSGGAAFLKTDTSGNQLWYNGNADSTYNFLSHAQLKVDQYNNIYLAASVMTNMGMCKVNSNGTGAWAVIFGTGYSQAFTIGTDYNVYVTGGATARLLQSPPVIPCNTPINLSVSNITTTSAKLNWSLIPGVVRYQVYYKKTGDPVWTKKSTTGTKNFMVLNNLSCSNQYKWKVRTVCDTVGTDLLSAFSTIQSFNTLTCKLVVDDFLNSEDDVMIYPNPVKDVLYISFNYRDEQTNEVLIYNAIGNLISTTKLNTNENEVTINVSSLPSGVYFVKIAVGQKLEVIKLVKQ